MQRSERKGSLFVIISAVLFGMMPLFTKTAYENGSNAYMAAATRFFLGSIMCLLFQLRKNRGELQITGKDFAEILKLSVFYALTPLLLYSSYSYIDSGLATTLHFTYPVFVIVLMAVFTRRFPSRIQAICTVICLAGIFLLYQPSRNAGMTGIVLSAFSGIIYAGYIVRFGLGRLNHLSSMTLTFWMAFLAALEIAAAAVFTGNFTLAVRPAGWFAEAGLAFTATFLAVVLFQEGIRLCGEIKTSLLSTLEPLTGVLIGILFYKEKLSFREMAGMICILLASVLLVLKKTEQ